MSGLAVVMTERRMSYEGADIIPKINVDPLWQRSRRFLKFALAVQNEMEIVALRARCDCRAQLQSSKPSSSETAYSVLSDVETGGIWLDDMALFWVAVFRSEGPGNSCTGAARLGAGVTGLASRELLSLIRRTKASNSIASSWPKCCSTAPGGPRTETSRERASIHEETGPAPSGIVSSEPGNIVFVSGRRVGRDRAPVGRPPLTDAAAASLRKAPWPPPLRQTRTATILMGGGKSLSIRHSWPDARLLGTMGAFSGRRHCIARL
ncbi:hypothetical protein E0H52_20035 [Rhizobium leguminosarum bv. viciae]|uniref:Uncharacterized protein n=1 Tax=Rhizobium leguminosarum bv. viciae TaxID=387 RepID=A0A8G2J0L3_RHILV|nr:hypothetical protein [Rhizobium leguminosarum bv. viciae]TBX93739.1 hypothetical protein E0H31_14565 [Rhizobium leguminosarum bv. viciae]TBZ17206.1 hypothetical protein E0H52_20035 [Rhizobium leguminosarum bv. viciae]